jgi:hypothetical protein
MQTNYIYNLMSTLYPEIKFWAWFSTVIIAGYKVFNYFKTLKNNDLRHIQMGLESLEKLTKNQTEAVQSSMKEQTKSIVDEMKELRSDFRSLTNAFIKPPSKPRTPRRRK